MAWENADNPKTLIISDIINPLNQLPNCLFVILIYNHCCFR